MGIHDGGPGSDAVAQAEPDLDYKQRRTYEAAVAFLKAADIKATFDEKCRDSVDNCANFKLEPLAEGSDDKVNFTPEEGGWLDIDYYRTVASSPQQLVDDSGLVAVIERIAGNAGIAFELSDDADFYLILSRRIRPGDARFAARFAEILGIVEKIIKFYSIKKPRYKK